MAVELGWGDRASHLLGQMVGRCLAVFRRGTAEEGEPWEEDEDVQRERYRIQDGTTPFPSLCIPLSDAISFIIVSLNWKPNRNFFPLKPVALLVF